MCTRISQLLQAALIYVYNFNEISQIVLIGPILPEVIWFCCREQLKLSVWGAQMSEMFAFMYAKESL